MALTVLFEDNHLLVVDKPAGLLVQADQAGAPNLVDTARHYLKVKYDKPGNVFVGLVHRLDRNVSGVVLLARTSKAASRLAAQFREKSVTKIYQAVVSGCPDPSQGRLCHWLAARGDSRGVTRASREPFDQARESVLEYRVVEGDSRGSLLEVQPITGRRHQIRAQLALAGHPLLGDLKYGAPRGLPDHRVALHAWKLGIAHPVNRESLEFQVEPPADWPWPATASKERD